MLERMAAVFPERSAHTAVEADVRVDRLHANAGLAFPLQIPLDLLWRPLLVHEQGEDPLAHFKGEGADATHAMLALVALLLRQLVMVTVDTLVAGYLTVNRA